MSWIKYINDEGKLIEEGDGWLIVDGEVYEEPGTDADFDRYAVEVQNGDGYYDAAGKFRWFKND